MNKRVLAPVTAIAIATGSVVAVGNADAKEMTAAELYEPTIGHVYDLGPDVKNAYLIYSEGPRVVSVDLNLFESPYSGLKMERDNSWLASPEAIKVSLEGGKIYPESFDVLTGVTVHYDDGSSEYVEGNFTVHPLKALVAGEAVEPVEPTTTPRATVSVTVTTTETEYFPEPYPDPYPVYETETLTETKTATFTEYVPEPYPDPYPEPYPVYETETVTETETVIVTPTGGAKAPADPVTVTATAVAAPVTVTEVAAPITKVATVTATPKVATATATTTVKVTETKEAKATETVMKTASASADNGSSLGTGGVVAIVLALVAALGAGAFALSGGFPSQLANALPL